MPSSPGWCLKSLSRPNFSTLCSHFPLGTPCQNGPRPCIHMLTQHISSKILLIFLTFFLLLLVLPSSHPAIINIHFLCLLPLSPSLPVSWYIHQICTSDFLWKLMPCRSDLFQVLAYHFSPRQLVSQLVFWLLLLLSLIHSTAYYDLWGLFLPSFFKNRSSVNLWF